MAMKGGEEEEYATRRAGVGKSEEELVITSLTVIIQTSSGRCTTDLSRLSNEF